MITVMPGVRINIDDRVDLVERLVREICCCHLVTLIQQFRSARSRPAECYWRRRRLLRQLDVVLRAELGRRRKEGCICTRLVLLSAGSCGGCSQ